MEHGTQPGRVERARRREGLEDIGLDRRYVKVPQSAGDMAEDVRVRVEDRHLAGGGKAGVLQEVPGAGTDVEVVRSDVLPVEPDALLPREPPHEPDDWPEDERVVEPQHGAAVVALPSIRGVVAIHGGPS